METFRIVLHEQPIRIRKTLEIHRTQFRHHETRSGKGRTNPGGENLTRNTKKRSPTTITSFNGRSRNICKIPRCDATPCKKKLCKDRTQSALTYILEYGQTEAMLKEGIYDEVEVQQRPCAVFGRVDVIRRRIDDALENDDMHRRRRDMCVLPLPKNFPEPQSMRQSPVPAWIR